MEQPGRVHAAGLGCDVAPANRIGALDRRYGEQTFTVLTALSASVRVV